MKPYPHQIAAAEQAYAILKQKGYVYIIGLPRSGKTYTAILTCELSSKNLRVLFLTKKAAISGIEKFTKISSLKQSYTVTNYEQLGKAIKNAKGQIIRVDFKLNPDDYDIVIIDESHNYGKVGKPAGRYYVLKAFCKDKPHIHLSGTPYVETPNAIYHQMALGKYTPFKHKDFYAFFNEYGIPETKYISGRTINDYTKAKSTLIPIIDSFTVKVGGFEEAHINDKLIYIELDERTKTIYNRLVKDNTCLIKAYRCSNCMRLLEPEDADFNTYCKNCKKLIEVFEDKYEIICETSTKLRTILHQLEGGNIKVTDIDNSCKVYETTIHISSEKILWIMKNIPLNAKIGIMSHFKAEQEMLKHYLPQAEIYSSNAHAEGVDLSHLDYFIIYSQDYSGAKHIQRRRRIYNIAKESNNLEVIYLLVKKAISEQVYEVTSKKLDFNNSTFERVQI